MSTWDLKPSYHCTSLGLLASLIPSRISVPFISARFINTCITHLIHCYSYHLSCLPLTTLSDIELVYKCLPKPPSLLVLEPPINTCIIHLIQCYSRLLGNLSAPTSSMTWVCRPPLPYPTSMFVTLMNDTYMYRYPYHGTHTTLATSAHCNLAVPTSLLTWVYGRPLPHSVL